MCIITKIKQLVFRPAFAVGSIGSIATYYYFDKKKKVQFLNNSDITEENEDDDFKDFGINIMAKKIQGEKNEKFNKKPKLYNDDYVRKIIEKEDNKDKKNNEDVENKVEEAFQNRIKNEHKKTTDKENKAKGKEENNYEVIDSNWKKDGPN